MIKEPLINNMIRADKVRVIGVDGQHAGVMSVKEALQIAFSLGLDLVEVSSDANPPVCKIINYGKYKYELSKKSKESKKHQKMIILKEVKISPSIGEHDLLIKINYIRKFLESGHKVKITINFKGRQITHTEFGMNIMNNIIQNLNDIIHIEKNPLMEGSNMIMMAIPK
ncbi:MAG: translation initiation factor IF-3 [Candidatus Firestonebacteria bacterium]|nr:translation initiation factor IF-3 [Candidatus Firestonebacteria bacterium]